MESENEEHELVDILGGLASHIPADGSNITVISEPNDFYQSLKQQSGRARKRIVLSSLYLGTGKLEDDLVSSLGDALERNVDNPDFEILILLDHSRATRGLHNSCTSLQRLFPPGGKIDNSSTESHKIKIRLFHTPSLRGLIKQFLPSRWNEIIGVQHMKLYIFDDSLLISGANLSDSYFTNRQDRYILVENCKELADYYSEIISAVSSCSFQLEPSGLISLPDQCKVHPYKGSEKEFSKFMRQRVERVVNSLPSKIDDLQATTSKNYGIFP